MGWPGSPDRNARVSVQGNIGFPRGNVSLSLRDGPPDPVDSLVEVHRIPAGPWPKIHRPPAEAGFIAQGDHQIPGEVHEAVTNFVLLASASRDGTSKVVEVRLNHPGPARGGRG